MVSKVDRLQARVDDADELKAQVNMNTLQYNHLNKIFDKLLFVNALGTSPTSNASVHSFNEELLANVTTVMDSAIGRVEELELELRDMRDEIKQNSERLDNASFFSNPAVFGNLSGNATATDILSAVNSLFLDVNKTIEQIKFRMIRTY